ncbi:hypothetical protein GCM10010250_01240 [Streptomyces althioticus]|uniref:hypothetical protein n=1 Tax=Streptomyces althioticus TaxID=83380 RepID=UPI001874B653|nr:hypothetical protein GCM10010250_01240 [Streptomyces althioticus]
MTTQTTNAATLADQAAEAIRGINHTTRTPGEGWQYPGDAYTLIGTLAHLSRMLPQAITQAIQPVTDAHQADRLTVDDGTDPAQAASRAVQTTRLAISRAMHLSQALDAVHSALAPLGCRVDDEPEEEPCGEGMCQCYCVGVLHACGCDCPRCPYCQQDPENCDCPDQ